MKKKLLALSVASILGGFAATASAGVIPGTGGVGNMTTTNATVMEFNGDGIGHVLLVPYYTAQNGNATLLNIVNTDTTNGKAVKVRFRGAQNSDDVFDFHLYLSPGDVWAGMVSEGADGRAQLTTADNSCTLPANVNQSFVVSRLNGTAAERAAGTREGYVEIFNMADIPPNGAAGAATLYGQIKHAANGNVGCGAPLTGLSPDITTEANAASAGFNTPSTGLMANWTIINVPEAAAWTGVATAIEARTAGGVAGRGNFVWHPQTATAVGGAIDNLTADPLLKTTGTITAAFYDLPDVSTPYVTAPGAGAPETQATAIAGALAKTAVINEYITDPTVFAATDWVFSMPTRRYAVAVDYTAPVSLLFNAGVSTHFDNTNVDLNGAVACVEADAVNIRDRSERLAQGTDFVISPGTPTVLQFCGEASVLSFNAGGASQPSVLGAELTRNDVDTPYVDGWARIQTSGLGAGLPILGAAFVKATNPNAAPGVSGNYGAVYEHRYTRP